MLWCNTVIPDDLSNQLSWRGNGQCQSQEPESNPWRAVCGTMCCQGKIFFEPKSLANQNLAFSTKAWGFLFIFNLQILWFVVPVVHLKLSNESLACSEGEILSKYQPESSWENVDIILEAFLPQQVLYQTNFPITINLIYNRDPFQISLSRHFFENSWFLWSYFWWRTSLFVYRIF